MRLLGNHGLYAAVEAVTSTPPGAMQSALLDMKSMSYSIHVQGKGTSFDIPVHWATMLRHGQ